MKERPILFKGEMVRAILDGRKTQTRRLVKDPLGQAAVRILSYKGQTEFDCVLSCGDVGIIQCPYGVPGDRLWVRETWKHAGDCDGGFLYRADPHFSEHSYERQWKPSIFMSRSTSRILLEITDVRVQRLQEISGPDCWAEGIEFAGWSCERYGSVVECYRDLWQSINGADSWDANPWVWAITFRRLEP